MSDNDLPINLNQNHTHKCRICGQWFKCWNPYGDSEKRCEANVTPKCRRCICNELAQAEVKK
jgi:hypothetical protein